MTGMRARLVHLYFSVHIANLSWKCSHFFSNQKRWPDTVFVFGNFRVHNKLPASLETFATRGKVVADKGKLLFSLVFTVLGNSTISFPNVAVNRTRLPVLGKSLRKSLPWSRSCPFIFLPGSGRFGYFSKDCDKIQDASQFSAAFDIHGNSQMGLAAVLSVVIGKRW